VSAYPDQTENLNPYAEARLAMCMFPDEYAAQSGGCMDFWNRLAMQRKHRVREALSATLEALEKRGRAP